ncbi:TIGR01212 family radical SAM protein [Alginatibacterium sediminis]|uniref:TIGR01212 family radical SAM protein n=1 Tax=Alginatibacterium sediminis TaxID=2164068 RepID=A0A420E905_9ALTE|nr:TIGR01212 family radical SAM protein [Alginatibacterium sediminis]RKF15818.1 TIGR01212 family radical SAM protein [Alginatibacterium sediminis]
MQLDHYVHTLGYHLKQKYQTRVRKLSIDAQFTCPNRDGSIGRGGCTFCNVDSFAKPQGQIPIAQQMLERQGELKHKNISYLAYFQAYTNTYAETEVLQRLYDEALQEPNVLGLCVGTRPDCVRDEVLLLLAQYQSQGKEVWLELGLQSSSDLTLKRINRGHDFAAYRATVRRAHDFGLKVCTHLILGLPGESSDDYMRSLNDVLEIGVEGLKLHPLHVVQGSSMAKAWQAGRLDVLGIDDYVAQAVRLIQHTPPEVIFHRVSALAQKPMLLAPDWCSDRWLALTQIAKLLSEQGGQGIALQKEWQKLEQLTAIAV